MYTSSIKLGIKSHLLNILAKINTTPKKSEVAVADTCVRTLVTQNYTVAFCCLRVYC